MDLQSFFIGLMDSYALIGFFVAITLATSSIIFPTFVTALLVLAAQRFNPFQVVLVGTLGSTIGEMSAYVIAREGRRFFLNKGQMKKFNEFKERIKKEGAAFIFLMTAIPFLPIDIVGLAAGTIAFDFTLYFLVIMAGKFVNVFIIVYLGNGIWNSIRALLL